MDFVGNIESSFLIFETRFKIRECRNRYCHVVDVISKSTRVYNKRQQQIFFLIEMHFIDGKDYAKATC